MIRHSMDVVRNAIDHLNPGQTPVLALDQPLFALVKQIQWKWPDKLVVMFGGLHVEIAALKTLGDWLQGSGWTYAFAQAEIASTGTADSFLRASHITLSDASKSPLTYFSLFYKSVHVLYTGICILGGCLC